MTTDTQYISLPAGMKWPILPRPDELVSWTNSEGQKIMMHRDTVRSIEETRAAVENLTQKILIQHEQFRGQADEIDRVNEFVQKMNRKNNENAFTTVYRGVNRFFEGVSYIVFLSADQSKMAAQYAKSLVWSSIKMWGECSIQLRCVVCTVLACGAVFVLMAVSS